MSIYARPGDFKNFGSLPLAITAVELEIPKHDFASPLSQPVSISVDEKYMIFSPGRRKVGHYAVRSWDADDHHGAVATLVNIFGGIMKCDVIAEGVVAAVQEVGLKVPLVVRLEGTNVELGKKILNESGLAITAADDLDDAAKKIVAAIKG